MSPPAAARDLFSTAKLRRALLQQRCPELAAASAKLDPKAITDFALKSGSERNEIAVDALLVCRRFMPERSRGA
jgi:hypothetical protein